MGEPLKLYITNGRCFHSEVVGHFTFHIQVQDEYPFFNSNFQQYVKPVGLMVTCTESLMVDINSLCTLKIDNVQVKKFLSQEKILIFKPHFL